MFSTTFAAFTSQHANNICVSGMIPSIAHNWRLSLWYSITRLCSAVSGPPGGHSELYRFKFSNLKAI